MTRRNVHGGRPMIATLIKYAVGRPGLLTAAGIVMAGSLYALHVLNADASQDPATSAAEAVGRISGQALGGMEGRPSPTDGVVEIPEASRQFIVVEAAGDETGHAALSAPARVEFREGAVSRIGAPLNGRVMAVHVRTGDRVKTGAPLMTLDSPDAAVTRSDVDAVTASLREARLALERERRMLQQGVGIEREKLAAETRVAELESALARAQAGTAFVGEGAGGTVVLRAPISGTIVNLTATVGMTVQQGPEPLVELGDPTALWIVADVFERDVPHVQDGAVAHIELASLQGILEGRVSSIGAVVASGLRTAPVRITLSSAAGLLRPGMYGRAEIAVATQAGYGVHAYRNTPIEAFPDVTNLQVNVIAQSPARRPKRSSASSRSRSSGCSTARRA
jgi:membrane fusion protein, heavy metal efflux system